MAKQSSAPVAKPATKSIVVDEAEFVRTRDAVITSWTRLHGALQSAIQAYIDHSNAVLGGEKALDQSGLNLLMNAAVAPVSSAEAAIPTTEATPRDIKFEGEDGDKKKRTRAKAPKDPNAPKRPLTAYLLYLEEMRPVIQRDLGPGQRRGDISSEGTRRWHEMSNDAKQVYKDRYSTSWQEYIKDLEAYKIAHPESPLNQISEVEPDPADPVDEDAAPAPKKKAPAKPRAKKTVAAAEPEPVPEPAAVAEADVDSGAESSSVSSDSDDSDDEPVPAKLPSPPKPAATTPAKKATPKTTASAKAKAAKAAVDASAATIASSPPRTNKKPKETFTAVNGKDTPNKKRKSAATADDKEEKKVAPKAKRAKKGQDVEEPEVEAAAEEVKEKKKPGRKRKSAAGGTYNRADYAQEGESARRERVNVGHAGAWYWSRPRGF
ncbi:HMG (high mobility group) box-containing protein [Elsinoe fawcettii]|nr:HMG (high mobility group) box-containing protein [Elsinoe fawcettii]